MTRTPFLSAVAAVCLWASGVVVSPVAAQIEDATSDQSAFALGTLTPNTGALGRNLWKGTDRKAVSDLLRAVPATYDEPLMLEVLRRVLLSPGEGPKGADNALAAQKFMLAARAGFYRDAASLAELVPGIASEPGLSEVVAYAELMDGATDAACARGAGLRDGRTSAFWLKLRFYCYVRAGENDAADLTLGLLVRQDALRADDERRFAAFAAGGTLAMPTAGVDVFDFAMLRERGTSITVADLPAMGPGFAAAIARDANRPAALREAALIRALARRTLDIAEARKLLDNMTGTALGADIAAIAAMPPGSLELAEAIGKALRNAGSDELAFTARSYLLANALPGTDPVINFTPNAREIALAGMLTGQTQVVEKWLVALAQDTSRADARAEAIALVELYGFVDPGAARRIGSYMGHVFEPATAPAYSPAATRAGALPVASLVGAALPAAEAGSSASPALLFLAGTQVAFDDQTVAIRNTIVEWARDRAELDWLDRRAAFRAGLARTLGAASPTRGEPGRAAVVPPARPATTSSGQPVPRVKPNRG